MPHSRQAFSAPSKQMPGSNPKGDLNSTASISVSSTISIPSSEQSASKPRDSTLKREQNPRYRHDNGLILAPSKISSSAIWLRALSFDELIEPRPNNYEPSPFIRFDASFNFREHCTCLHAIGPDAQITPWAGLRLCLSFRFVPPYISLYGGFLFTPLCDPGSGCFLLSLVG